jgi:hypothetical protein
MTGIRHGARTAGWPSVSRQLVADAALAVAVAVFAAVPFAVGTAMRTAREAEARSRAEMLPAGGSGLAGLNDRVTAVGGSLTAGPEPGMAGG